MIRKLGRTNSPFFLKWENPISGNKTPNSEGDETQQKPFSFLFFFLLFIKALRSDLITNLYQDFIKLFKLHKKMFIFFSRAGGLLTKRPLLTGRSPRQTPGMLSSTRGNKNHPELQSDVTAELQEVSAS